MKSIAALHAAVTAAALFDGEPSNAELDAIDRELPVILADVVLLDAQIMTIGRTPSELDHQRIRRAQPSGCWPPAVTWPTAPPRRGPRCRAVRHDVQRAVVQQLLR